MLKRAVSVHYFKYADWIFHADYLQENYQLNVETPFSMTFKNQMKGIKRTTFRVIFLINWLDSLCPLVLAASSVSCANKLMKWIET